MAEKLQAILDSYTVRGTDTKDKLLGAAFVVVDKNGAIYSSSSGRTRVDPSSPAFTPRTVTWIASMTKLLTPIALLHFLDHQHHQEQQQNNPPITPNPPNDLITLDTPTAPHLPELAAQPILLSFTSSGSNTPASGENETPPGEPILLPNPTPLNLRHLLTHTSGLGLDISDPNLLRWSKHVGRTSSMLSCTIDGWTYPLCFQPGEGWYYGIGPDWAGVLLQRVTGVKLGEYLRRRCFGSGSGSGVELERTGFVLAEVLKDGGEESGEYAPVSERAAADAADGEGNDIQGALKQGTVPLPKQPEWESGGFGAYSCAEDVGRVLSSVLASLAGDGDSGVLKQETAREMLRPQLDERQRASLRGLAWKYGTAADVPEGIAIDHGLCGLLAMEDVPGKRRKGSSWFSGLCNSRWWLDPETGIGAALLINVTPYNDATALKLFDELERAVYAELVPGLKG